MTCTDNGRAQKYQKYIEKGLKMVHVNRASQYGKCIFITAGNINIKDS